MRSQNPLSVRSVAQCRSLDARWRGPCWGPVVPGRESEGLSAYGGGSAVHEFERGVPRRGHVYRELRETPGLRRQVSASGAPGALATSIALDDCYQENISATLVHGSRPSSTP